jgi:RimJ/RimL family protein N-acetyltransferase
MDLRPVTLTGTHVVLEPLRLEHAQELWSAANEPELWKYMLYRIESVDDLRAWIRDRVADPKTALPFLQRDAKTGQAFGSSSLFDIDLQHIRMEIGHTWVGRTHRRTAANTESKLLLLRHGFEGLDANRIQLKTDARNERSRQAILRIGAQFEGILRSHMVLLDGHRRDTAMHSIVREEWPQVRGRLEAMLADPGKRS